MKGSTAPGASELEDFPNSHLLIEAASLAGQLDNPKLRLVDVRAREDYDKGHLRNAVSAPLALFRTTIDGVPGMAVPAETLEEILGSLGISNGSPVVACDEQNGMDAARFLWTLEYYGHRDVRVLHGGVAGWRSEGRPLVTEVPSVAPARYRATPHPELLATLEQVRASLGRPDVVLLDVRTPQEYSGQVAQATRNGHIPGAINLEWVHNLEPAGTGRFKPAAQLRSLYESAGVTLDREVVSYCRTAHRAAHSYLALRLLGYPRVRLYDGSWVEWGNRADTPVECS